MAERSVALRRKLPEIALEAAMVVFAVLVAFGVDEWREQRQLREFADAARRAVETEIAENARQFREAQPMLTALTAQVEGALETAREGRSDASLDLSLRLPQVSTAAWDVAQSSQGAPYFDYDWVIRVARAYEGYGGYAEIRRLVLEDYSRIFARRRAFEGMGPQDWVELLEPLSGRLWALGQAHREVQAGLENLSE